MISRWWIGRRETIARKPPFATELLEDEQLLIGFGSTTPSLNRGGACRTGPGESPVWRRRDDLNDGEPDLKGDGCEQVIVCAANVFGADGRGEMRSHENAIWCIESHNLLGTRCVECILIAIERSSDRFNIFGHCQRRLAKR